MADKFISIGINEALPYLKDYDKYLAKVKKIVGNSAAARIDKAQKEKQPTRRPSLQHRRSRSVGYQSEPSDFESEPENGRRLRRSRTYQSDYDDSDGEYSYDSSSSISDGDRRKSSRARGRSNSGVNRPRSGSAGGPKRRVSFSDSEPEPGQKENRVALRPDTTKEVAKRSNTPGPNRRQSRSGSQAPKKGEEEEEWDSDKEIKALKKAKRNSMIQAGLAAAATINMGANVYNTFKATHTREEAIRKGEMTEQEARRNRNKHIIHDVASLAVMTYAFKGTKGKWAGASKARQDLADKRAKREERLRLKEEGDLSESSWDSEMDEPPVRRRRSKSRPKMDRLTSYSDSEAAGAKSYWPGQSDPFGSTSRNTRANANQRGPGTFSPVPPPPVGPYANTAGPPARAASVSGPYPNQYPGAPRAAPAPHDNRGPPPAMYNRNHVYGPGQQYTAPPSRTGSAQGYYPPPPQNVPPQSSYNAYGIPSPVSPTFAGNEGQQRKQGSSLSGPFFGGNPNAADPGQQGKPPARSQTLPPEMPYYPPPPTQPFPNQQQPPQQFSPSPAVNEIPRRSDWVERPYDSGPTVNESKKHHHHHHHHHGHKGNHNSAKAKGQGPVDSGWSADAPVDTGVDAGGDAGGD